MLVLVRSYPDTEESRAALDLAESMKADVVFLQNGVYHKEKGSLGGFTFKARFIDEDLRMRGLSTDENSIGYHELVDVMADAEKVAGLL